MDSAPASSTTKYRLIAPLHDYQKRVLRHVLMGKGNALFLEMGLGKTVTTLEIIHYLMKWKRTTTRVLALAPRRICEQVWIQEKNNWNFPISIEFLKGSPSKRLEHLMNPTADVYLMTYENLIWLEKTGFFPFDMVVLDELSKMKSSSSKRWRAFRRLLSRYQPRTLGLTGTPAPNGYPDLWAQMYCLDQGETLGPVKGAYLGLYFKDISREPHRYHKWVPRMGSIGAINEKLKEAGVISMRAKDVLNQKDPIRLPDLRVELSPECRRMYREMERELMISMPDGQVILPDHAAVAQTKLRQLSSGFLMDENRECHTYDNNKVKILEQYIEEMDGEPLMVVYTYRHELQMILETFPGVRYLGGGVDAKSADWIIGEWNRGELPVLLVQPAAAGHGLNLQKGGHHILFYSSDWNLENYQQVIARLNRQGQKNPVFVRHIVAGDVESQLLEALSRKASTQESAMEALKV